MAELENENFETAKQLFEETLQEHPELQEAKFFLDAMARKQDSDHHSQNYVKNLFDRYASRYDEHLVGTLGYKLPKEIAKLVRNQFKGQKIKVLDLGCGTGLCGSELNDLNSEIIGIDLSDKMLAQAKQKQIYNSLHQGDIAETTHNIEDSFDVIIASDVLCYGGDWSDLFAQVKRLLKDQGRFYFSVESTSNAPYHLQPSGRYAHNPEHIIKKLAEHDLNEQNRLDLTVRKGRHRDVEGILFEFA